MICLWRMVMFHSYVIRITGSHSFQKASTCPQRRDLTSFGAGPPQSGAAEASKGAPRWIQEGYGLNLSYSYGYGSIPINTIFSGMNIHKSQLFWCELQGYKVLTHCHMNGWINIQQYKFILVWCTRMYQGYPGFWSPKDLGTIPEAMEHQYNCIIAAAAADGKPLPGPTRDSGFPRFPCCEERPRISVISFAEYFRGRGKLLQSFCSCWSVLVYWFRLCLVVFLSSH